LLSFQIHLIEPLQAKRVKRGPIASTEAVWNQKKSELFCLCQDLILDPVEEST